LTLPRPSPLLPFPLKRPSIMVVAATAVASSRKRFFSPYRNPKASILADNHWYIPPSASRVSSSIFFVQKLILFTFVSPRLFLTRVAVFAPSVENDVRQSFVPILTHFSAACNSELFLAVISTEEEVVYYSHTGHDVVVLQHVLVDTLQLCVIICVLVHKVVSRRGIWIGLGTNMSERPQRRSEPVSYLSFKFLSPH
jgi:hypothetical protein